MYSDDLTGNSPISPFPKVDTGHGNQFVLILEHPSLKQFPCLQLLPVQLWSSCLWWNKPTWLINAWAFRSYWPYSYNYIKFVAFQIILFRLLLTVAFLLGTFINILNQNFEIQVLQYEHVMLLCHISIKTQLRPKFKSFNKRLNMTNKF